MSFHLFTVLIGFGLAGLILYLLRRDYMHVSHAMFWFVVAAAAGVLGAWPRLIDRVAGWVGIYYSPALLLLIAVIVLAVKALQLDGDNTRLERDMRKLNQRLAVLEGRLEELAAAEAGREDGVRVD